MTKYLNLDFVPLRVMKKLKQTAKTSPNRAGSVFAYDEFRRLLLTPYKKAAVDLIEWIMLRFCAVTLLLGCLRSEQFNRFRDGGLAAIEWLRDNQDRQGKHRPVVASVSPCQGITMFRTQGISP